MPSFFAAAGEIQENQKIGADELQPTLMSEFPLWEEVHHYEE